MVRIISRKEWGAVEGDGNGSRPLPVSELWLHHSVTTQLGSDATFASECAEMRKIEQIGKQRFGSHYGFPYTFAVFPSGRVYEGHALGQRGAHTAGSNTPGAGICWPGNYDVYRPAGRLVEATASLIVQLHKQGKSNTHQLNGGHRDSRLAVQLAGSTACPGRYAHPLVGTVNSRARALWDAPADPKPPSSSGLDSLGRYTVRPGDTLGRIASTYRTSVSALVLLNGISDPDRIDVGDRLYTRWVVGRGDTLSEIADRAGTSVSTLVRLNGIRNADRIQIGQLIRLP